MIAIHDLVKTFGDFTAVDRVSLEARAGEIHGFLGPNGAGKTTTIRIIAGLLKPTAGQIVVNGHDLATDPGTTPVVRARRRGGVAGTGHRHPGGQSQREELPRRRVGAGRCDLLL